MSKGSRIIINILLIIALLSAGAFVGTIIDNVKTVPLVMTVAISLVAFIFFTSVYNGSDKGGHQKKDDTKGNGNRS